MRRGKSGKILGRPLSLSGDRDLEVRFSLLVIWLVLLGLLSGGLVVYTTAWSRLLALPYIAAPEELARLYRDIHRLLGLISVLAAVFLVFLACLIHYRFIRRIAGPALRLEKCLRAAAAGRLPEKPLVFRRNDFLSGIGEAFNELATAIRTGRKFE